MRRTAGEGSIKDPGASLIMALVFLAAVGPMLAALVTLTGTNLLNTNNLNTQRNIEFAADTVVDGTIQNLRHQGQGTSTQTGTYPSPSGTAINGISLAVWYRSTIPTGLYGRIVDLYACPSAASSLTNCMSRSVLQANILFDDVGAGCTSGSSPGCYGSAGDWGTAMTIEQWNVRTANG